MSEFRFCPMCAEPLGWQSQMEDGGEKLRLRCGGCTYTHWNNPTPVLAGIVQVGDEILLARNAAWPGRRFALITGFMEANESPEEGIAREIAEETNLTVSALKLVGAYEFKRMNQIIIAYHAVADGEVRLSPELAEYKMYKPEDIICWPAGTGYAVGDWLRSIGIEPRFMSWEERYGKPEQPA
jgi:NADH pyrophosphatase NudC (nudix superfamily)